MPHLFLPMVISAVALLIGTVLIGTVHGASRRRASARCDRVKHLTEPRAHLKCDRDMRDAYTVVLDAQGRRRNLCLGCYSGGGR